LSKIHDQTDLKRKGMAMLKFIKSVFRVYFDVILWINLILFAICGGVIGNILSWGGRFVFPGILIGVIIGFIIDLVGGGIVSIILNIDENIEQIKNGMKNESIKEKAEQNEVK
jgi:hypothetical protein